MVMPMSGRRMPSPEDSSWITRYSTCRLRASTLCSTEKYTSPNRAERNTTTSSMHTATNFIRSFRIMAFPPFLPGIVEKYVENVEKWVEKPYQLSGSARQ